MAQLGNNSTFNRGLLNTTGNRVVKGYHSRTVFSYATENPVNLFDVSVVTTSTTDGIQYLIDNSGTNDSHGTHIIPAYYWRPGKIFRVSGTIIANAEDGAGYLNMRFGLKYGSSIAWLAIQNNNNNHQFANNGGLGPLPVDFSCDIFCSFIESDVNSNLANAHFGASGYYQYTYSYFNSVGNNTGGIHVPIWSSTFVTTGLYDIYSGQSTIMFNLFDSSINTSIYVTRLTIEELA